MIYSGRKTDRFVPPRGQCSALDRCLIVIKLHFGQVAQIDAEEKLEVSVGIFYRIEAGLPFVHVPLESLHTGGMVEASDVRRDEGRKHPSKPSPRALRGA